MIVTIPLLSHRDNNRTVIYKTMPKMIITYMRYQRTRGGSDPIGGTPRKLGRTY